MLSLRARTIWSIIITALLVAGVVAGYAVMEARKIVEKEAYAKLQNFVGRHAADFNQELIEVQKSTRFVEGIVQKSFSWEKLKNEPGYMEHLKQNLSPSISTLAQQAMISKSAYIFFKPELENRPNDVWFADLDNSGKVKRQEQFPLSYYNGDRVRRQWYYQPMDSGKAAWTDVYQGTVEADHGVMYTSYTLPVKVDGKVVGVAGSDYFFDRMFRVVSDIKLYQTGYAFLADEEGRIMIHPSLPRGTDLRKVYGGQFTKLADLISEKPQGVQEYKWIDGREKLMVFVRLANGWVFAAAPYKSEVYADAAMVQSRLYMMLGVGFVFAAFMGVNLGSFLTKPVIHLTEVTHAIGEGNYDRQIETKYLTRTDEVGILAGSVENMRKRQRESFKEIRSHTALLEDRVEEKTEELRRTNEYLEISMAELEEQHAELVEANAKLEESYETLVNTQKRLIESEKIAALGYLVSGVAHEVNTPVGNGITLATHIEEETRQMKLALEKQRMKKSELIDYFEDVGNSSKQLFTNLSAIMDVVYRFKELATEKTQVSRVNFSPREYMRLVLGGMQAQLDARQVRVTMTCSETLMLEGDPIKFSQIFSNLVGNALHHAFEGVEEPQIDAEFGAEASAMILTVRDNGSGIEEEHLKNIFVPFFSTKFNNTNKGLGLSVVYNIVHKVYDGDIVVESSPGKGTAVVVRLHNLSVIKV